VDIFRRAWVWGLIGFAAIMVVYVVLALLGWPGDSDSCTFAGGNCYCEAFPAADVVVLAKQPINTLSALFPVIAGLIILAITDRDRAATVPGPNPMATGRFHALLYGGLVVFLGPGSMFFHGSLTHYGGWLDNFSMILYVTFLLLYDAARIWRWDDRIGTFAAAFVAINVALGLLTWLADGSGTILFAILAGVAIVSQAVILLGHPGGIDRRFVPWLLAGLASFGIATIIWALSATGRPLCDPNSLLQGHAVWHLLAMAVTPFCIFWYLRGETRA
jgi:hypothetical protein